MPRGQWSAKRERQYEHIRSGLEERGTGIPGRSRMRKFELEAALRR